MKTGPLFKILSTCKGGGYRYCRTDPPHPKRNSKGLYPLHRVILENKLGRLLKHGEIAHHRDEDKTNDAPKNIRLRTNAQHSREHAEKRAVPDVKCVCPVCRVTFLVKARFFRLRSRRSERGEVTCSRKCGMRLVWKRKHRRVEQQ